MVSSQECVCAFLASAFRIVRGEGSVPRLEVTIVSQNDLSTLLAKAPRNCWLALNEEQTSVVGRGETIAEAVKEASQNGVQDPIVLWAPKSWYPTVYQGA